MSQEPISQEQSQETVSAETKQENRVMTRKLVTVAVIMLAFGFALVPLYDVFCEITGWNSSLDRGLAVYQEQEADTSREIKVRFVTVTKNDMPWDFRPLQTTMKVHPGKEYEVAFRVKNRANKNIIGQAIPSFSPVRVSQYFNKTECFCFNQQTLMAGAAEDMPMRFFIDKDLPKEYDSITLVYTLHNVSEENVGPKLQKVAAN
ncbi:cytochrome c oxidase assembly protein [Kangiella sp. TOML190]|uniref:cytochrome c oxidase assembly protein n=1 Tax=Kangiella sp. TOML190 TaxID=2931351 RepID=UPI00203BDF3A|nr:cytochrome c oxidase assembly protein [Kangiella sp. TOML190]